MNVFKSCLAACLFSLIGVACAPAAASPSATPIVRTVVETQIATQLATHVVTAEVTRLVDVPVTLTPTPTAVQTPTPTLPLTATRIPSATPTYSPPRVTILADSGCWYGPGFAYLYFYQLNATVWMAVYGRNMDGSWLLVRAPVDEPSNACWIRTDLVRFDKGELKDVPIVWKTLPYATNLYLPPSAVSTTRSGNEVSIFWQPVYMTEDDYRGYLIEAWVCQGGKRVFLPVKYETSFAENNSMMEVKIIDEPGCDVPSSARIYSAEKHGYTAYRMIPWPGFNQ